MEMIKPVLALSVVFLVFLMTPALVAAQSLSSSQVVDFLWVRTFGFQKAWLSEPREIILQVILPTVAIYAIFLGLTRTIGIFSGMGESMEHVIALVVALASLFMGFIGYVSAVLAGLGTFSFWLFAILFVAGAFLYAKGWIGKRRSVLDSAWSDYRRESRHIDGKIKEEEKKIKDAQMKAKNEQKKGGYNAHVVAKYLDDAAKHQVELEKLLKEKRDARELLKDIESGA